MQMVINLAPVSLSNKKKVNFYINLLKIDFSEEEKKTKAPWKMLKRE